MDFAQGYIFRDALDRIPDLSGLDGIPLLVFFVILAIPGLLFLCLVCTGIYENWKRRR